MTQRSLAGSVVLAALLASGCTRDNPLVPDDDDGGGGGGAGDGGGSADGGGGAAGDDLATAVPLGDYRQDGHWSVDVSTVQVSRSVTNQFAVTLHVPVGPGPFAVVVLSSGLLQPAAGYAPYAQRLASFGIVTVTRDDRGFGTQTSAVAEDIGWLVATWLPAQEVDSSSVLAGKLDLARVGLAGHSRGGQASLLAAETTLKGKVKGFFGLDPVDGKPPFSPTPAPLARTALATIGVPTVFLGETTDASGGMLGMSCAPAADNYQVLYAAAASPSVQLTAVGADHTDFEDPNACQQCNQCTPGAANGETVLAYSVKYLAAFFVRELLGDSAVGASFAGVGAAADVAAKLVELTHK